MKKNDRKKLPMVLIAIIITGLIALPFGDFRLISIAIGLEIFFIVLLILILIKKKIAIYLCIIVSLTVIAGNTLASPHINIMMTFSKPVNAILLIIGGYALQILLIYYSIMSLKNNKIEIENN